MSAADNPVERWLEGSGGDGTPVPAVEDFVAYIERLKAMLAMERLQNFKCIEVNERAISAAEQLTETNRRAVEVAERFKAENNRLRAALNAVIRG